MKSIKTNLQVSFLCRKSWHDLKCSNSNANITIKMLNFAAEAITVEILFVELNFLK